jgi:hypothetical protein
MDIFLIVIIMAIIIAIGLILSKPFMDDNSLNAATGFKDSNDEIQYQQLLRAIKTLEDRCKAGESTDDICDQLDQKKRQAANLLRLINPNLEEESSSLRSDASSE